MENTQGGSKLKQERENEDSKRLVILSVILLLVG